MGEVHSDREPLSTEWPGDQDSPYGIAFTLKSNIRVLRYFPWGGSISAPELEVDGRMNGGGQ